MLDILLLGRLGFGFGRGLLELGVEFRYGKTRGTCKSEEPHEVIVVSEDDGD
jgi:hypothetical protein